MKQACLGYKIVKTNGGWGGGWGGEQNELGPQVAYISSFKH